ncbi:MAG TPA: universal stress protein [Dehalococcoidia bacterium]|nr:universal stress protein [Dehalococcoidia bacterium]
MAKTILVTTDGSPRSHLIIPHASALARACGASMILCRVLDPRNDVIPEPGESQEAALSRGLDRMEKELQAGIARFGLEARALAVAPRAGEATAEAILRAAEETGAALIAMQSRGSGMVRVALFGSVSHDVVQKARVPVMVGGPNLEPLAPVAPYSIVATTDGSAASEAVLRSMAGLLEGAPIRVYLLKVFTREAGQDEAKVRARLQSELDRIKALLPAGPVVETATRAIAPGGGVDVAIVDHAVEVNADAIAMSLSARSTARALVLGNTAELVLQRSRLPVILARSQSASA